MTLKQTATPLAAVPARSVLAERLIDHPIAEDQRTTTTLGAMRAATDPRTATRHPIDAETVIRRLEEAGHTLLCLPRAGPSTQLRQTRHQYVAEAVGAFSAETDDRPRPAVPSATRITRMDQALAWIPLITADRLVLRRIVGCRCLVSPLTERHLFTWRRLARLIGADHKAVQRWHATGIDIIVATLRRDAALAAAWDTLG